MRSTWALGEPMADTLAIRVRRFDESLVWWGGPVICTLRDTARDKTFLAVLSDEGDGFGRWLHAEMSAHEAAAVRRGVMPFRDVLTKGIVHVVDRDYHEVVLRAWEVDGATLDDEHLPDHGACLPDDAP